MSDVSREMLLSYQKKLFLWNKKINLIGKSTEEDFWNRHVEDSRQISNLVPKKCSLIDIGSGAGIPGLILAIIRPDLFVNLVDVDFKKTVFLKSFTSEIKNIKIHNCLIEKLDNQNISDIIISRAFASLSKVFQLSSHLLRENGKYVLHKGENFVLEVEEAKKNWEFDLKVHESRVANNSYILEVLNLRKNV